MLYDLVSIGRRVRQARVRGAVSQAELARLADVSRATVNALENGTLREIGIRRLSGIVEAADGLAAARIEPADGKPKRLELSFPYDWSNPDIADEVLIRKVVERGVFEDLARISVRFGVARVAAVAEDFAAANPYAAVGIRRMMSNIGKALADD